MSDSLRDWGGKALTLVQKIPPIKTAISNAIIQQQAKGDLPIVWTTAHSGRMSMNERLEKEFFSLMLPQPEQAEVDKLPDPDTVISELFARDMSQPASESRLSLLQLYIAQHLTDAVFQSDGHYRTEAPHEIILNQIYGNHVSDRTILRSGSGGKLKSQWRATNNGTQAEFPPALCERVEDTWQIKAEFTALTWLQKPGNEDLLLGRFKDKPEQIGDLCATALFQGNVTAGNFALTTLLLREHNRLAEQLAAEYPSMRDNDNLLFDITSEVLTLTYMKLVMEEYINTFAGLGVIEFSAKNFFHETKRWCEDTPIPFHFNILYRLHSAMPNEMIVGDQTLPFSAFLTNNTLVMDTGLTTVFEAASLQPASDIGLLNTHPALLQAEKAALIKSRSVLQPFNAHRRLHKLKPLGFDGFDPRVQSKLQELYGTPDNIEYMVGVFAERKVPNTLAKFLPKGDEVFGEQLSASIGQHAFRHILSNPLVRKERFNEDMLTKLGLHTFETTKSFKDIVLRNTPEIPDAEKRTDIYISTNNPRYNRSTGRME